MSPLYATLVTRDFASTVNFYEDFFGFAASVEQEQYAFLESPDNAANAIAVFDARHPCVDGQLAPVQGVILNIASHDVLGMYDYLYMEGVEVFKEPGTDVHGRKHFVVYDPNRVLVNVYEPSEQKEVVGV